MSTKVKPCRENPRKTHVKPTRETYVKLRELQKNFKQSITKIEVTPEIYKDKLNNIQGDTKTGFDFSEVVNYSLAYLVNYSFQNLNDTEYNLETFKAILDKANLNFRLGYKPNILKAYNGDASARNTDLFIYAYCIIQFDYYFKSIDLKNTDFYKYTQHYFKTGQKLDFDLYNGDKNYLLKEYDKMQSDGFHRAELHIQKAFTGSLLLLLNELNLETKHFENSISDCREYNAMTKTPREFRKYFPFKLLEFDIKNAFPRFIDEIIDSNISSEVYQRVMDSKNLNRDDAKKEFNKWLNSSKYKTAEQFYNFFEPIYKEKTNELVKLLTNKDKPFWKVMFYWEFIAIETFVKTNKIENYTRLHDAVFVVDNEYSIPIRDVDFSFVSFGAKKYFSKPGIEIAKDKKNATRYTPAIPYELRNKLIIEINHTEKIENKSFNNFRIYKEPFYYLNANFNIGANGYIKESEFHFYDVEHFEKKLQNMVNVIAYKNELSLRSLKFYLKGILNYILENSVLTFDLNDLLDFLIIGIEEPIYKFKNHTYNSRDNLNMFEYQKAYFKALKMFDSVCYAESIFSIVETSYLKKEKLFIDFRQLDLRKSKGNDFIFELINKFNQANGIKDVRTADSFKSIIEKKRELAHTIKDDLYSMGTNALNPSKIRDFDNLEIRPQTKQKFQKWLEFKQDLKAIQKIYFQLIDFIEHTTTYYKVDTINGRNEIVLKEHKEIVLKKHKEIQEQTIKPFLEQWNELKDVFNNEEEHQEYMKLSILKIEEMEAVQLGDEFYKEWKRHNPNYTFTINHYKEQKEEIKQILFEFKKGA